MDEDRKPSSSEPESLPQNIYDIRLTFTKNHQGLKTVTVSIRYSKIGKQREKKIPFPEDIKDDDLIWGKYEGNRISVYHRMGNLKYRNMEHLMVPTELAQKLERLVLEAHRK